MFRYLFSIIFIFNVLLNCIFASSNSHFISENSQNLILQSNQTVSALVKKGLFIQALQELDLQRSLILNRLIDVVKMVFPERYLGYSLQQSDDLDDDPFLTDSSVNLFNLVYQHDTNGMVTISLLQHDPAIEEYLLLSKNPSLLEKLGNAELVKIRGSFDAVLKSEPEQQYVEYNILVKEDVLLNVVAVDVEDEHLLQQFVQFINLHSLKLLLYN